MPQYDVALEKTLPAVVAQDTVQDCTVQHYTVHGKLCDVPSCAVASVTLLCEACCQQPVEAGGVQHLTQSLQHLRGKARKPADT